MEAIARTDEVTGCQLISDLLRVFGCARVRVNGSSMLPCLLPGDVLDVQRQELDRLATGDIALFARNGRLFAHRVIEAHYEGSAYLVTRGDSLGENDSPVFPRELLGRVTCVHRGESRISPPPVTHLSRTLSVIFTRSFILTRCLLWLLGRARSWREGAQCRA